MRLSRRAVLTAAAVGLLPVGLAVAPGAPAATPVFGNGTPTFVVSQAPSSLPGHDLAGEPSLGVNPRTGAALYMAGASTYRLALNTASQPATIGWSDASSPYSTINLDPILATDPVTGVTLAGGDTGACAVLSRSTDDGATWRPSVPCTGVADHPTVGFGPFAQPRPLGASGDRIAYYCQQQDLAVCSRSLDGGVTWSPGVSPTGCLSLFGHVKVGPDGTAYVPNGRDCVGADGKLEVGGFASTDNGLTWHSYGISGADLPGAGFDPSVGITPDNTVYESFARAGDYHPVVASSGTHGATWSPMVDLAGTVSPPIVASTFQTVVTGDNGRLAVAFLGTQTGTPGANPFTTGFHGVWNLFVSTSYDAGRTWTTSKVTSTPVQRGEIDGGGTTTTGQRNLLDFMDASLTADGRVVVGYATGCNGACAGSGGTEAQSVDQWASAAVQTSGRGLYARYDTF